MLAESRFNLNVSSESRLEKWILVVFFILLAGLHLAYLYHYRIDSDEPQHLHVVWGWTQGQLPYRDFFDNHTPLFQFLCSPLMRLLGERADIVILMRYAMLPLFVASLWAIWKIVSTLYSLRAGLWAVILAGLGPNFILTSAEFRTDDLWVALWFLTLALLAQAPLTGRRMFLIGLVFGTAFGVSMKTSLMLAAVAMAFLTLGIIRLSMRERMDWRELGKFASAFLAGLVIVPALIVLYFVTQGAWKSFYYCVIQHNTLPGLGKWNRPGFHTTWFPLSVPIMFFVAYKIVRAHQDSALGRRRVFPFLAAGFLYYPMRSYWPLLTRQDFLPVTPLVCAGIAVAIIAILDHHRGAKAWRFGGLALLVLLGALEIEETVREQLPWKDKTAAWIENLATNLRIVAPADLVMDAKGETIFRRRPVPQFVMEGITLHRFRGGLIVDDIPETLIRTRTCAATTIRMPWRTKEFIFANYLPSSTNLFLLGKEIGIAKPGTRANFQIVVPGKYCVLSERGKLEAILDGTRYEASQSHELEAGPHELQVEAGEGRLVVAWAPAVERGFQPFARTAEQKRKLGEAD